MSRRMVKYSMIREDKERIVPDHNQRIQDGFKEEVISMQHPEEKEKKTTKLTRDQENGNR